MSSTNLQTNNISDSAGIKSDGISVNNLKLNNLSINPGSRKKQKLVGRGIGSGKGKTSGRGGKGQTARSGVAIKGFEGGQTPLHRRLPKRGFKNSNRIIYSVINCRDIVALINNKKIDAASLISKEQLISLGYVNSKKNGLIKLLATGSEMLSHAINIQVDAASKNAVKTIEDKGGKVSIAA